MILYKKGSTTINYDNCFKPSIYHKILSINRMFSIQQNEHKNLLKSNLTVVHLVTIEHRLQDHSLLSLLLSHWFFLIHQLYVSTHQHLVGHSRTCLRRQNKNIQYDSLKIVIENSEQSDRRQYTVRLCVPKHRLKSSMLYSISSPSKSETVFKCVLRRFIMQDSMKKTSEHLSMFFLQCSQ